MFNPLDYHSNIVNHRYTNTLSIAPIPTSSLSGNASPRTATAIFNENDCRVPTNQQPNTTNLTTRPCINLTKSSTVALNAEHRISTTLETSKQRRSSILKPRTDKKKVDTIPLPNGGSFTGELVDGFPFRGEAKYPGNIVYSGEFQRMKWSGRGKLRTTDCYYNGNFSVGRATGEGTLVCNNGCTYDGVFDKGLLHYGTITNPDDVIYTGPLQEGIPNGEGKLSNREMTYAGGFKEGAFHGVGTLMLGDGTYKGQWLAGKPHGKGTLVTKEMTYVGDFKEGLFHGKGHVTSNDEQEFYDGEWNEGKAHGHGIKYFSDSNSVYEGEFKNNLPDGYGIFNDFDDDYEFEGEFVEGRHQNLVMLKDGSQFHGLLLGRKMDGLGILTEGLDEYFGEFKNNLKHGIGVQTFFFGDSWQGIFVNGQPTGEGLCHKDGKYYEGPYNSMME